MANYGIPTETRGLALVTELHEVYRARLTSVGDFMDEQSIFHSVFRHADYAYQTLSCPLGNIFKPLFLLSTSSPFSGHRTEHDIFLQAAVSRYVIEVFQFT